MKWKGFCPIFSMILLVGLGSTTKENDSVIFAKSNGR
jgi:hypothetical protein